MAKPFFKRLTTYIVPVLLIVAATCAATNQMFWSAISGFLTVSLGTWQYFSSLIEKNQSEIQTQAQAKMMQKAGLGNLYSETIHARVDQAEGRAVEISDDLVKAYKLDPNDNFALSGLATAFALGVSGRNGRGANIDPREIQFAKKLCRRGRKLYPQDSVFPSSLGVLADSEGNHEIARLWFHKAAPISPPGYWRLHLATSYALSGEFENGLKELQLAIQEGANGWIMYFYAGRALCSLGRFKEALPFLLVARKERPLRLDVIGWTRDSYHYQLRMTKALVYRTWFSVLLLFVKPLQGLLSLGVTVCAAFLIAFIRIRKGLYLFLNGFVPYDSFLFRLLKPDRLEVIASGELAQHGQFNAAEAICREGLAKMPDSYELAVNLACSLAFQGRRDEAVSEIDKALIKLPNNELLVWNRKQILTQPKLNPVFVDKPRMNFDPKTTEVGRVN